MYQSLPVYNQHGELVNSYDYDNNTIPWSSSSPKQYFHQRQVYQQSFVKHPYYPQDPSLSPMSAYTDFEVQQQQQHYQSPRRPSLASSIDSSTDIMHCSPLVMSNIHQQISMNPLEINQQHISISPTITYAHQHIQNVDMTSHHHLPEHGVMSSPMSAHSHGVGVGVNPVGVNPVGVLGHDIDSAMVMDPIIASNPVINPTIPTVEDMSEEDAEGEDDWEQLNNAQNNPQEYQPAEVYQNTWSEEVDEEQIHAQEAAAVAAHHHQQQQQQQHQQEQQLREARKSNVRSARKSQSATDLSQQYPHPLKPDPADEDDRISRSSIDDEDFEESSEEDIDDDDDDDEFIPGQQASQRRRRHRSTTASSRRSGSGSNHLGYTANGNDSAPSLHHYSQNQYQHEGRRTSRSTGAIRYNTYSSYIEQANAAGYYEDANGEDAYSSGSVSPGPDGGRSLSRGSADSTATSTPSMSSSSKQRRSRPPSNVPIPVPVPNLTKKSRGRRVPTMSSIEDLRSAASGAGRKRQNAGGKNARMYLCDVEGCGKCFARGEHLKRHVRSIHTYEKPHRCPYPGCGKDFSRHDNLGQHMRVHKDYVPPPGSISSAGSGIVRSK
ncbi:hypothetical protein CVT24_007585 [Panaeolus cyanescens]|uniref:C2H2-type domain-containing protein n=1 Tax=Panaeolus cyanescens TaxID=181874 RepID=A0A409WZV5_9AGAR|nr:hypothetical protein CVT24_007585 [Panaeolus cyanescens]